MNDSDRTQAVLVAALLAGLAGAALYFGQPPAPAPVKPAPPAPVKPAPVKPCPGPGPCPRPNP